MGQANERWGTPDPLGDSRCDECGLNRHGQPESDDWYAHVSREHKWKCSKSGDTCTLGFAVRAHLRLHKGGQGAPCCPKKKKKKKHQNKNEETAAPTAQVRGWDLGAQSPGGAQVS